VSQLLDALRRASQLVPAPERRPARQPSAEAILLTMGYAPARRARSMPLALLAAAVVIGGVGLGSLFSGAPRISPAVQRDGANTVTPLTTRPVGAERVEAASLDELAGAAPATANRDSAPKRIRPRVSENRHPAPGAARFQRAVALQRAGRLDQAARAYRDLLADAEMAAAAHNNLGLLYRDRGELDRAVRHLENALELNPLYVNAHNNLGVVLLALGRADEAAARFRRAAGLAGEDPDALVNLALAEKAAGRTWQARESLLRALALAPDNAAAHYNLAVLYDRSGEVIRAMQHYRAFLDHSRAEHAARAAEVRARLDALAGPR
jgi:tetratricopeptide (TPR) repeat protein